MTNNNPNSFPLEVVDKFKNYVYRLIDPRDGETFYVGKGKGNRIFSHIRGDLKKGDDLDDKLARIRDIQLAGFEVAHVIHRHGMDESKAFEVEAAIIDAYPGLTNIMGGAGSNDYGAMHAQEIISHYCSEQAEFHHKALLISVNRSATERSLYTHPEWIYASAAERMGKFSVNNWRKACLCFGMVLKKVKQASLKSSKRS